VRQLPVAAFVALVLATVGAFFVVQHLKVSTPLLAGHPRARPAAFNPVDGGTCRLRNHLGVLVPTSFKRTQISFYLLHRADDVDLYVIDGDGDIVDTLASGRHMAIDHRTLFTWDGRTSNGTIAPDGTYEFRISLIHQGRSLVIPNSSVTVERAAPKLTVTGVTPAIIPTPGVAAATARFTGAGHLRPRVLIYRSDPLGRLVLVKSFAATTSRGRTTWDGTLAGGAPAPQGTYLVGLKLTDAACNTARFPSRLPPAPGSTSHAGVTVRYLAAQPPMTAVPAGTSAVVDVDARQHRYLWVLRRTGARKVLRSGSSDAVSLRVPLPGCAAGLYELTLRWGGHRTAVPLVASAPPGGAAAKVLVVLPALTWQGENPVDDDNDGIPNTLTDGEPIRLARPLVDGLPAGFADEAALIAHLRSAGLRFDLTTDLGLLENVGPTLTGRHGVVLAGDERWLPAAYGSTLSTFVEQGGHVLSLGIDSLRRSVTISAGQALDPGAANATDDLLARPGRLVSARGALILVDKDGLNIFRGTSGTLRGYASYQPFTSVAPPAAIVSAAGAGSSQPAVIGYRLGHGDVVDIGLPGFGSSLAHNLDASELLASVWRLLGR
jgi:flagellar hook assembly protein FlgD